MNQSHFEPFSKSLQRQKLAMIQAIKDLNVKLFLILIPFVKVTFELETQNCPGEESGQISTAYSSRKQLERRSKRRRRRRGAWKLTSVPSCATPFPHLYKLKTTYLLLYQPCLLQTKLLQLSHLAITTPVL